MAQNDLQYGTSRLRNILMILCLLGSVVSLSACYQSTDITLHEPGKYKGPTDPLLAKVKSPELRGKLTDRFKLSQTDR